MTEPADVATKDAYEGAIRSFTEADIALRQIVTDLQRFRSASNQVAEAGVSLGEALAAVERSSQAVGTAVVALTSIAASLASATQVITALDPARFWESFDRLEVFTASSAATLQQAIETGFTQADVRQTAAAQALDTSISTTGETTAAEVRRVAADLSSSITTSGDRLANRLGEASDANQKTTRKAAEGLSLGVSATQRLASQARALAVATIALGAVAVSLLVLLVVR
jgi:hypothetical protein